MKEMLAACKLGETMSIRHGDATQIDAENGCK